MTHERVSEPGRYRGFTEPQADGYARSSVYVSVRDACRLALDVLHPTLDDKPLTGRRPTVLIPTGYRRAWRKGPESYHTAVTLALTADVPVGGIITSYEASVLTRELVHRGYVVAVLDMRGTGASFGRAFRAFWGNGRDVADVIEWVARQPWSNGRVGLTGGSWGGCVQLMAAAARPPHLRCIMPLVPPTPYNAIAQDGLRLTGFVADWAAMRRGQDQVEPALPVDGDDGERLLAEALRERADEHYMMEPELMTNDFTLDRFRALVAEEEPDGWATGTLLDDVDLVNAAGVPTYLVSGWWDLVFVNDVISLFGGLRVPKRLLIGPWHHNSFTPTVEACRWFDHWLRDAANGIMEEPPVVHGAWSPEEAAPRWYASAGWPPAGVETTTYYLGADGALAGERPSKVGSRDAPVDYGVTLGDGIATRHLYREIQMYPPDLDARAERCLSWTSGPLPADLHVCGAPVLVLRLATTAVDGVLFVTLEDLPTDGPPTLVSEGRLNLLDRALAHPSFPRASGVWHAAETDLRLAVHPNEVMELAIELLAVGWRVRVRHRLRVTVAAADAGNFQVPIDDPPPVLTALCGGPRPARLELPVMPSVALDRARLPHAFADEPFLPPFCVRR